MNAPVTRRALLGASTAALGAKALPVTAALTFVSPTVAESPDGELLALIARHAELLAAWHESGVAFDAAMTRADAACRPRPEALFQRWPDHNHDLGGAAGRLPSPNGLPRSWYNLDDIDRLRAAGPVMRAGYTEAGDIGGAVPDPEGEARRQEILAAAAAWAAASEETDRRAGFTAAMEAEEQAHVSLNAVEEKLNSLAPLTLAGVVAKARWASVSTCDGVADMLLGQIAALDAKTWSAAA